MSNFKLFIEALENDPKHIIGNAAFAIETNLAPLKKRIIEGRSQEALEIVQDIEVSIEKIKQFLANIQ